MVRIKNILVISTLVIVVTACSSTEDKDKREIPTTEIEFNDTDGHEEKSVRIKKIFYTLPSPLELTMLFKKEGIRYHSDILHSTTKRSGYESSLAKALNLGIYGADLSFSGLHARHGETIQYFAAAQSLAADLGVDEAFQHEFIARLEQNAGNKDTLLKVVSEFFVENDKSLNSSSQQDLSTFILASGWIEGVFLGTNIVDKEVNSKGIRNIISNQKDPLHNIIVLLESTKTNESVGKLLVMFKELEMLYSKVEGDLTVEQFNRIKIQVEQLRIFIINLQ